MALTAKVKREFVGEQQVLAMRCAGNDTFYEGALLHIDGNGYLAVPSDTTSLPPAGVYSGRQGSALAVAASTYTVLEMLRGLCWVAFSGAAQSDVGELFYLSDDNTLTQTAGSKTWGLLALDFKTGYVLIDFANPVCISTS